VSLVDKGPILVGRHDTGVTATFGDEVHEQGTVVREQFVDQGLENTEKLDVDPRLQYGII